MTFRKKTKLQKFQPEEQGQLKIVETVLRPLERAGRLTFTHVPNQFVGRLGKSVCQIMGRLGVQSGVSDLLVFLKGGQVLFIELKTKAKPDQRESQEKWQAKVEALGYKYHLVIMDSPLDGVAKVIDILALYGVVK